MSGTIIDATDADFAQTVAKGAVLVDFWADWCGPCKTLAPALVDIAEEYAGEIRAVKVDVVANPLTAERFGIRSIPALLMMKGGEEIGRSIGALSKTRLAAFVDQSLLGV